MIAGGGGGVAGSRWESLPSLSADAAAIDEAAPEDGPQLPPCCAF